jgi:hypothetical protein
MRNTAKKDESGKPMDDGVTERAVGVPVTNSQRVCWAIKTLVAEVHSMFPETTAEYSDYDGRNTALAVTFDLTPLDADTDRVDLANLLELLNDPAYNDDRRIREVIVESDDSAVYVSMRGNPRTQDSREPFGLADALEVLTGGDEGYDEENDWQGTGLSGWPVSSEPRYPLFEEGSR